MKLKTLSLLASASAVIILPAVASAQSYYEQPRQRSYSQYDNGYGQRDYGRSSGDYYQRRRSTSGVYPQFRGIEQHIRSEIASSVRDDMIARDDAQDLLAQLRDIQNEELREYRVHGWNLPYDDQQRIQQELSQLDQLVDQTRQEQ